jgi:hypothetical protein
MKFPAVYFTANGQKGSSNPLCSEGTAKRFIPWRCPYCGGSLERKRRGALFCGEIRKRLLARKNGLNSKEETDLRSEDEAVVRAHDWYQRIVQGELTGAQSIARATGLDERYVGRVLQCAFLAPDIVESILEGRQPAQMTFDIFRRPLPIDWSAQRRALGFPGR